MATGKKRVGREWFLDTEAGKVRVVTYDLENRETGLLVVARCARCC